MVFKQRTALLSILLVLHLLFAPGLAPAQIPQTGQTSQTALEQAVGAAVARALRDTASMGVNIVELDTGETVLPSRPDELRVIASNSKLFTTAAALDALGAGLLLRDPAADAGDGWRAGCSRATWGWWASGDPQISGREYGGDPYGAFRPWAAALRAQGSPAGHRATSTSPTACSRRCASIPEWPRDQLTELVRGAGRLPSLSATTASWCGCTPGSGGRAGAWWRRCRRCRSSAWTTAATDQRQAPGHPPLRRAARRPADASRARSTPIPGPSRPG